MNHTKKPLSGILVPLLMLLVSFAANAQVQTARYTSMTSNTNGYYEYLPQGYNPSGTQTYPLIVFIHGIGELGSGSSGELPKVLANGVPRVINDGRFPTSFIVNGQTFKFIAISPQFVNWPSPQDINGVIDYAVKNYKVDPSRMYVTGLSMGGGATWEYAGNNSTYASRIAALVPVCGASWPDYTRARTIAAANLPVWATHNDADGTVPSSYTIDYVNNINQAPAPNPLAKKTIFQSSSHDAWTQTYDPNFRENGMNIYEWMLQYQRGGSAPSAPAAPTYTAVPGKIEAENYFNMNGVQTESTSDAGGGQNIGYIDNGDWMDYNVNPSATGTYTVNFRVASQSTGGQLQLKKSDGTVLATVAVPNTGGWQTWQTVSAVVTLSAGQQTLRVASTTSASWNINWFDIASGSTTTNNTPSIPTTSSVALPGKIEAESFTGQNGTQNENTSDAGGGQDVGYIDNGDWMDYSMNPSASGSYTVSLRVASQQSGGQLQLRKSDGTVLATVAVPNTGGWQTWQTVIATVNLTAGTQTLRVASTASANWNINWIDFSNTTSAGPLPTTSTSTTRIEAESFTNQSGTQTEGTADAGGGQDVGYIDNGDWMDYSMNPIITGTYTVNFRVATQQSGGQFQLRKADGTVLATVTVPNTGGWQTWQTVSAVVSLASGQQTLKIVSTSSANWNINWFETTATMGVGSTSTASSSLRVEAESFANQSGTQTEGTSDAGGGQDVGYIDNGDWMDYSVSPSTAGSYTVNFRVATQQSGGQFQLRKSDGTVLATITVPNTGGWQTWQTVSANVTLAAGQQTLRIVSTASPNWNINWFELVSGSAAALSTGSTSGTASLSTTSSLSVYPNPVTDKFVLDVNNSLTGALKAQLYDMNGTLQKEFSLTKSTAGDMQFYLSIGTLPTGTYVLKATMTDYSETTQIVKQ